MFLLEPAQTQFDLRFRIFRIPVRVHPMFWVVMAFLGWGGGPGRAGGASFLLGVLAWVVACFLSVLWHEMGHVFMGRLFGSDGHIVLYSFGGLAVGSNALDRGWQRALVSFAGPLAQFLLLGVFVLVLWFAVIPAGLHPLVTETGHPYMMFQAVVEMSVQNTAVARFLDALIFINLFWPLLNLLPIWPLDGGQIMREACLGLTRDNGVRLALAISVVVAGLLAVNALVTGRGGDGEPLIPAIARREPIIPVVGELFAGGWFMVILFGMLAVQNVQLFQAAEAEKRWREEHWEE